MNTLNRRAAWRVWPLTKLIKRARKIFCGGPLPMLRHWKSLKKLRPGKWFCLEFHLEACPCERSYCCCSCCCLSMKILLGLLVFRPSISSLLQSATSVITQCDSLFYYKARWPVITKCDRYYKTRRFYYIVRKNKRHLFKNALQSGC